MPAPANPAPSHGSGAQDVPGGPRNVAPTTVTRLEFVRRGN